MASGDDFNHSMLSILPRQSFQYGNGNIPRTHNPEQSGHTVGSWNSLEPFHRPFSTSAGLCETSARTLAALIAKSQNPSTSLEETPGQSRPLAGIHKLQATRKTAGHSNANPPPTPPLIGLAKS